MPPDPLIPPSAHSRATAVLRAILSAPHPPHRAVLLTGPSGSGKTTLLTQLAADAGITLTALTPSALTAPAGPEAAVTAVFAPDPTIARRAILADHLDVSAPPGTSALRVVAALSDALSALHADDAHADPSLHHPLFLAAAPTPADVHPALVRPGRIALVLELTALSLQDRIEWSRHALRVLFPADCHGPQDDPELESPAHALATLTPGFLHADMARFLSRLRARMSAVNPPCSATMLLASGDAARMAGMVAPSLLVRNAHLYDMEWDMTMRNTTTLPGLEATTTILQRALHAALASDARAPLRGVLLTGPTGAGKSALLRRLSSLLPARAANVLAVDATEVVSSQVGQAERALAGVFAVARAIAPAVVILDDVELLAPRRRDDNGGEDGDDGTAEMFARVLSMLLVEIDGVVKGMDPTAPVIVVAATRDVQLVDRALIRPGRLDVHVQVPLPDAEARQRILDVFFEERRLDKAEFLQCDEQAREAFTGMSTGWTAADVKAYASDVVRKVAFRGENEPKAHVIGTRSFNQATPTVSE